MATYDEGYSCGRGLHVWRVGVCLAKLHIIISVHVCVFMYDVCLRVHCVCYVCMLHVGIMFVFVCIHVVYV